MTPVDTSLLDKIITEANKKYGEQVIHAGDETVPVYRIPWDSLELNLATYGGAPMGRVIRLWGGPSSCKTLLALGLAKQAQQHRSERFPDGLTVAYYNTEGTYDPVFTRDVMGVDISKPAFTVVEKNIIEDVSRNLDSLLHAVHVHIIDSTTYATSIHRVDAKKESRQPGLDAQAWKDAMRTAELNMDKEENMIIVISHETIDFNTGASRAQGSKMLDFASSMTIKTRSAKKLYRTEPGGPLSETRPKQGNDELTGTHRIDGYYLEAEVVKSKVCRPFGKANMIFDLDILAFDRQFELMKAGIFLGVIEKSGSYYKIPTSDKTIHGEPKLKDRIAQDDVLVMAIYQAASKYMRESAYA